MSNPFFKLMEEEEEHIYIALIKSEPDLLNPLHIAFIDPFDMNAFGLLSNDELIVALCFASAMLDAGDLEL